MLLQPGTMFAGYRVIRRLGAGGMGQVYLVEHPSLHRREALKIISANTDDPDFFHRFANEARVAASLDHPGIVTVHAHGVENGTPWFTMSYLEGRDLYHSPALPIEDVSHIIGRVADALDYAHARRIIHRDIKPANIVITTDPHGHPDRVTVLDFGIARLIDAPKMTATSAFIGTLAYAAPEVLSAADAGPRSDQYALACTAFALFSGTPPYPANTPGQLIAGHIRSPIPRLSERVPVPAAVDAVLARALAKNPAERFATCREFATELRHAAAVTQPMAARGAPTLVPSSPAPSTSPLPPRGPVAIGAAPPARRVSAPPPRSPGHSTPPLAPAPGPAPIHPQQFSPTQLRSPLRPPVNPAPPKESRRRAAVIAGAVLGMVVVVAVITGVKVWVSGADEAPSTVPVATDSSDPSTSPATQITGDWTAVSAGGSVTCGIKGGTLLCWGDNDYGSIGDGTATDRTVPTPVKGLGEVSAVSVAVGTAEVCAVSGGTVYCWGQEFGSGDVRRTPVRIDGISDVTAISTSGTNTCAIRQAEAYCWGNNVYGTAGTGTTSPSVNTPTKVPGLRNVTAVAVGIGNACAITRAADLYCWGKNETGQIGDGTQQNQLSPVKIDLPAVTSVSLGPNNTCAAAGQVYCWGYAAGQYPAGTETDHLLPETVGVDAARDVANGGTGGCASVADGHVMCWGPYSPESEPSSLPTLDRVTRLVGLGNMCAISAGQLYCWGLNTSGQLGNGSSASSFNQPARVRDPE
ncbi:protein kinase [Gordonia sp. VNQ95]|uniref:protein kinase domain-containing protein n=1 Tax=Gordonia sp. VNQ95 TaxID=3156619 RepID=UPI0032B33930